MKKTTVLVAFCLWTFAQGANAGCTFSWHHYGDEAIKKRIAEKIGAEVSDSFCKYAKSYEIVLITSNYATPKLALGHAVGGLRKIGTTTVPTRRMSGYRSDAGNYVIAYTYDLAATAAIDAVIEIMADIPGYLPN